MNEMMLAFLGFATIIMIIVVLLRNVTVPAIAFIGVSTVTAFILIVTGTFSVEEMLKRSCGVWMSKLSGPKEMQSRFSIFPEKIPHSSPAWMASSLGSSWNSSR